MNRRSCYLASFHIQTLFNIMEVNWYVVVLCSCLVLNEFFWLKLLCYSLFIFPPIFCCSLSIDNLDSGSKLCVMYSIEPYFRGTKRCLFIWSMSLGAPSTNCCRSMEPLGSLLFRIIRGRYFLVLPIYMEETPCIGDASTTCLFVITEPII